MTTTAARNSVKSPAVAETRPETDRPLTKSYLVPHRIGATMAAVLAHRLRYLDAAVTVLCRGRTADAGNPVQVLYLDAYRGTGIVVTATGPDSEKAIAVFEQALAEPWYVEQPETDIAPPPFGLRPTGTCA